MPRRCIMGWSSYSKLFKFPSETERRSEWLKNFEIQDTVGTMFACSNHFSPAMFSNKRPTRFALPNQNLFSQNENVPNKKLCTTSILDTNINILNCNCSYSYTSYIKCLEVRINSLVLENNRLKSENENLKKEKELLSNEIISDAKSNTLGKKNLVLSQKNSSLIIENETLKKQILNINDTIFEKSIANLSQNLKIIIQSAIENAERPLKGKRYDPKLKTIALATYFLSPMSYRNLRTDIDWPSPRTLREFVSEWPNSPGLKRAHLNLLKARANDLTNVQKYVTISCDEMSLKTHMFYDRKADKIIGLEDYGDQNRSSRIANSVMVFMVQGIGGQAWKQPICYYFVHNNCNAQNLKKYLIDVIEGLQSIGLKPVHFVCDQGTNFVNLFKILNISIETPYFEVNSEKIFVMHDGPHLMKSTRNSLVNYKNNVYFQDHIVSWKDIEYFYAIDSNLPIRCAPKLTDNHINPHRLQYMKVRLATQVFSKTVVSGMNTLYSSGFMDSSKAPTMPSTSEYLLFFNDLFDLHNSSNPKKKFGKELYTASENQLNLLRTSSDKIKTIKIIDKKNHNITNRFSFLNGWCLNNESLRRLFHFLKECGFKELSTRRLCQDNLEHFFGQLRRGSGNSETVTPTMFSCLFKKRWGINYINVVKEGNCEIHDEGESSQRISNSLNSVTEDAISDACNDWEDFQFFSEPVCSSEENLLEEYLDENMLMEENAFTYVCGYLYKKLTSMHKCLVPIPVFEEYSMYDKYAFTQYKEFDKNNLVRPPNDFILYIKQLNSEFVKHFDSCNYIIGISKVLYEHLKCVPQYKCCANLNSEDFTYLFIRTRIYFILKFFNRDATAPNLKSKVLKLSHL